MIKVRMKVGGNVYPFTTKIAGHSEAEVVDMTEAGEVLRVVDKLEWSKPGFGKEKVAVKAIAAKPAPKKKVSKKSNKQSAIPDAKPLENIDVSSI